MQTKSILRNSLVALAVISAMCIAGCTDQSHSNKKYPILRFNDFTSELQTISGNASFSASDFRALRSKHGRFFDIWFHEIMGFPQMGSDSLHAVLLQNLISANRPVFRAIQLHYKKYPDIIQKVSNAFGHLNELLGNVHQPVVYSYFSQFSNYNTFIDTSEGKTVLAFSSEMFMNDTFPLYKMLEVPEFFNRYNNTAQLPARLVQNFLKAEYEPGHPLKNMLDEAVFNGKIWYTMQSVFGEEEIWKTFGYSEAEWQQMVKEEGQIWRHYLNEKMLFNSNFSQYKRYFAPGNHTFGSGIPPDCPPLIGSFTGYRIVSAWMEKQGKDLKQMWAMKNAGDLYRQSAYNPIR